MFFYNFQHNINIYKKNLKNQYIKYIYIGTNSKNCFIFQKKNKYFYSFIKKNINFNNIKIFQNNLYFPITKIFFNFKNLVFNKKINGFMIFLNKDYILIKLLLLTSKIIKNINKINIKKNFFFFLKIKNFISKKFFFLKKLYLKSNLFSHNDIFKDNLLILGNIIISLIDFNNYIYIPINNDLLNLILEFSNNYNYKKYIIIEYFFKSKKNYYYKIFSYIFKIFFIRKKKIITKKKIKNSNSYLKKNFFYENF